MIQSLWNRKIWKLKVILNNTEVLSANFKSQKSTDLPQYLNNINLQYQINANSVTLEPQTGWAIKWPFGIIAESYAYWRNVEFGWPPYPSLKGYLNPFKKARKIDQCVSFHYGWDNYYHFFLDTLPMVLYWKTKGDSTIPWLIPDKMKNSKFVSEFLEIENVLEGREVIYQKADEYILVRNKAVFIKRSRFKNEELNAMLDQVIRKVVDIKVTDQKIFVVRHSKRTLTNLKEIIDIAESHGFKIIEASKLTMKEQIRLFRGARYLIGLHGAGLTNMIFRKGLKCSVMEVFPKNKIPTHYWHLTKDFGFNYSYLIGESMIENENYGLDIEVFKKGINQMLHEDLNLSL